jgi:hypothetical protein
VQSPNHAKCCDYDEQVAKSGPNGPPTGRPLARILATPQRASIVAKIA